MDWTTIITSVTVSLFSSSLLTAGIVYMVKRSFDRTLDLKFDQLLEKSKLDIQEDSRRKAALYDEQKQIYQSLLSTVYKLRNLSRELGRITSVDDVRMDVISEYRETTKLLQEALYNNRAVLPESIFRPAHDAKNRVTQLDQLIQLLLATHNLAENNATEDYRGKIIRISYDLDEQYTLLVDLIQPRLGILQEKG